MKEEYHDNLLIDELKNKCVEELSDHYNAGVPDFAMERLNAELKYINSAEKAEPFILLKELYEEARKRGQLIMTDGSSAGSMLVFLLGGKWINPLPAHYYCETCGKYELVEDVVFGIDLPAKKCSGCGKKMRKDGFSIPHEMIWREKHKGIMPIEYRCSGDCLPYAVNIAKGFYGNRKEIRIAEIDLLSRICLEEVHSSKTVGEMLKEYDTVVTAEEIIDTGFLTDDEMIDIKHCKKYYDMACALVYSHNTYENAECFDAGNLAGSNKDEVFFREEIYEILKKEGYDDLLSAKVSELIWLGKGVNLGTELKTVELPERIQNIGKRCVYLFPRGFAAQLLVSLIVLVKYKKLSF